MYNEKPQALTAKLGYAQTEAVAAAPSRGVVFQLDLLEKELAHTRSVVEGLYEAIRPICHQAENAVVDKEVPGQEPSELGQRLEQLNRYAIALRKDLVMMRDRICL